MSLNKVSPVIGVFAALAAFAIDQITKAIVVANAATLSAGISVFPRFNLVFYRNDGVTFGMLGGAPWWSLIALALVICVWLGIMLFRADNAVETLAYGAMIGGALGNVIDRVRYRAVTDFLDFYIGTTHWPAFNLADVFVVSGVGLLLAAPWISARRSIKS
ncbi:lipoprotein signal peptidase [Roseobacter sp. OBYS 0001]|uniref:Lipoprotein signal peptidase n=2 Tax=Roseobacteraceae TaxID=2854170 RepID=A0ABT3BI10_9RHOB|nr:MULTISPECIES: signal peptidase II [Roseobacter]MCV3273207.1 signal peptidase II [Roseobacter sp. WL0113]GIT88690.1 lipoprotein signal peptidase [Roseobacter sp. OBYS 0001]